MPVTLRLMRFGKKKFPSYRIVAIDKRKKNKGAYIENIGTYNPIANPAKIEVNKERMEYWLKIGAETSEGLRKLLKRKISH